MSADEKIKVGVILIGGQPGDIMYNPAAKRSKFSIVLLGTPLICQGDAMQKFLQETSGYVHVTPPKKVEEIVEDSPTENLSGAAAGLDVVETVEEIPKKKRNFLDWWFEDE